MANWSDLPSDILTEIALKFDAIEDFIRLSAVCRSWNHVYSTTKGLWSTKMPWLLLIENNTQENPDCLRKIFNPINGCCYQMKLPQTFGARCWGVEHGWIAMIRINKMIQLFNPITKAEINLPSVETMPHYRLDDTRQGDWYRRYFVRRFFLLKVSPSDCVHEFLVVAIHGDVRYLSFTRPGDRSWTLIETPEVETSGINRMVSDVVYRDGTIFILYHDGVLGYCDTKISRNTTSLKAVDYVTPPKLESVFQDGYNKYYLAGLDTGELFMIIRYKEYEVSIVDDVNEPDGTRFVVVYHTTHFDIFSLDTKDKVWNQVDDMGEIALFVGSNPCIPVRVTKKTTNNIKRNCIYFTDDEEEVWHRVIGFGGHDMGKFDMKSKTITTYYQGDDTRSEFCPPQWFIPQF